jgi:peptidylprolyl isomerase
MQQAKTGDTVKVHYTGTLADGTEFDSSRGRDPLEFTLGQGALIPGFENAVVGMSPGDTKTVEIAANDAYGDRHEQLTKDVPRTAIPDDIELQEGMVLRARGPEGQDLALTVVSFDDQSVMIDGNHPLAGNDLTFTVQLVEIGRPLASAAIQGRGRLTADHRQDRRLQHIRLGFDPIGVCAALSATLVDLVGAPGDGRGLLLQEVLAAAVKGLPGGNRIRPCRLDEANRPVGR